MSVTLIGLDIAKHVFQVCGLDATGEAVLNRRLSRAAVMPFLAELPATTIAMEACPTAHHWARELAALGHEVRLLPPRHVKGYRLGNKTDRADAAAICAALKDGRIRPVPVKTVRQQAVLALHRSRALLVAQRTATGNQLRALFAEVGLVARQGRTGLKALFERALAPAEDLPEDLALAAAALAAQWATLDHGIARLEAAIMRRARADATARRLMTIPGVGPITATALAASVGDIHAFASGRHLAAWLGLTPREHQSGLKRRQGPISRCGDRYLRRLLILGAQARMRHQRAGTAGADPWLAALRARRPAPVAAVALAAKTARIAWAVMAREEAYRRRMA